MRRTRPRFHGRRWDVRQRNTYRVCRNRRCKQVFDRWDGGAVLSLCPACRRAWLFGVAAGTVLGMLAIVGHLLNWW